MLRVQSARKPGNVLPTLSGAAGFEPRPPGRRSLRSNQLSYRRQSRVGWVGKSGVGTGILPESSPKEGWFMENEKKTSSEVWIL